MVTRTQSRNATEINLRHVWLAALGTAVVVRRQARATVGTAFEEAARLRGQALRLVADAGAVARGGLLTVREQVEPRFDRIGSEAEARLAPVLDRLGLKPKARRPARKARKPAAKKAVRRPAAARRKAEQRIVRKGR